MTGRRTGTRRLAVHCGRCLCVTTAQEVEAGGSFELKVSRPAWPMQLDTVLEWK